MRSIMPLKLLSRVFLASLFVGTIWMTGSGCWDHDHHDDHDDHWDHHDDHDHDHHDDWH